MAADIIIFNIAQLATARGNSPACGDSQGDITILKDAYIAISGDIIACVGTGSVPSELIDNYTAQIDAKGQLVTSGLVDCHTHLTFGGWREDELYKKLHGQSYMDILKAGGGILSTVEKTRSLDEQQLYDRAEGFAMDMLAHGTTALEAKSGYGLDLDTELKQLSVNRLLRRDIDLDIVSTYLGAHAVPIEYVSDPDAYVDYIINVVLPKVAGEGLADYCDVFCEQGVFNAHQARQILTAARDLGLLVRLHADELNDIGATAVASELNAISADHLTATTDEGIKNLKDGGVIATVLPCTSFYLGKDYARARDFINAGVAVAIGSDFNPGSTPNLNLQLAMQLACLKMKLTPEQVLTAATLNSAAAIGMADRLGTLEVGKQADIVIWQCANLNELLYRYGTNLVCTVIKRGRVMV